VHVIDSPTFAGFREDVSVTLVSALFTTRTTLAVPIAYTPSPP
jgi:hypothetical protein